MAKKSMVARNNKRKRLSEKHMAKRVKLKEAIRKAEGAERMKLQNELAKLPLNSSPVRIRNRCALTGRPRGYYRRFGLARGALRKLAMAGVIPGITKASW
ncbi:MAG: 30S ribosomal protein S14 [Gammaproteobacteria bacterium]